MNTNRQTAVIKENDKESKMKIKMYRPIERGLLCSLLVLLALAVFFGHFALEGAFWLSNVLAGHTLEAQLALGLRNLMLVFAFQAAQPSLLRMSSLLSLVLVSAAGYLDEWPGYDEWRSTRWAVLAEIPADVAYLQIQNRLAPLAQLTALQWLDLSQTPVTDAGLAELKVLRGLRVLWPPEATSSLKSCGIVADLSASSIETRPACTCSSSAWSKVCMP
jgi:hypothetical protein